ncbi:MAG: hypothetical protein ACLTDF_03730 [Coprococcus sp.]
MLTRSILQMGAIKLSTKTSVLRSPWHFAIYAGYRNGQHEKKCPRSTR